MSKLGRLILESCIATRFTNNLALTFYEMETLACRSGMSVNDVRQHATKLGVWVLP